MTTKTQFEIETGWSEEDAAAMAKEARREHLVFGNGNRRPNRNHRSCTNATPSTFSAAEFERQTGWKWSDAVDMASEVQRERRIFGDRNRSGRPHSRRVRPISDAAFKRLTGWSVADACAEAKQAAREHRLFGHAHGNN